MGKAIVWATSVAFLLSGVGVGVANASTRKIVNVPPVGTIFKGGSGGTIGTGGVMFPGGTISGEYIPAPTKNVPVPVTPSVNVPNGRIGNVVKGALRGGAAGMAATATTMAILEGLDWVMGPGGQIQKKGSDDPYVLHPGLQPETLGCGRVNSLADGYYESPGFYHLVITQPVGEPVFPAGYQYTSNCKPRYAGRTIKTPDNKPGQQAATAPLTEADWLLLDDFILSKDGTWQRRAAVDACESSSNPDACYKSLPSGTSLSGPNKIIVPGEVTGTTTQTNPDGSTTTTTTTDGSTITITYGDNYYDYSVTNNTTTTGSDGTKTETDETMPFVPNLLGGVNGPLSGLPGEIAGQASTGSSLPYSSWFSLGGGACKEWSFDVPVVGIVTTNYCPIHEKYVRPFLFFIFALWTWHTCFAIWRETVTRVRAS